MVLRPARISAHDLEVGAKFTALLEDFITNAVEGGFETETSIDADHQEIE